MTEKTQGFPETLDDTIKQSFEFPGIPTSGKILSQKTHAALKI